MLDRDSKWTKKMAQEIGLTIETIPFDEAKDMGNPEAQVKFLCEALKTGDPGYIAQTLGLIVRARGMSKVARDAGLSREALYRALSPNGNPKLSTLLSVTKALNIHLEASSIPAK